MARQKEFDRDEVLHKAMEVFWMRGYEGTSIQDLVKYMGSQSPGLNCLGRSGTYVPETE